MDALSYITSAGVAYALGSIPTGFLVARSRGIDIRSVGSGNIGATNVFRALGKPAGVFVLLMDALKGWVAVVLGVRAVLAILGTSPGPQGLENHELVAALGAVLGHNYTCWLGFKGGKGIATSAGVLLALVPLSLLIILTVWILVFAATRYVSLGSIAASAALPLAAWGTGESPTILAVITLMAALAIYRHRANIQRLLHGTESRFGAKPGEAVK